MNLSVGGFYIAQKKNFIFVYPPRGVSLIHLGTINAYSQENINKGKSRCTHKLRGFKISCFFLSSKHASVPSCSSLEEESSLKQI